MVRRAYWLSLSSLVLAMIALPAASAAFSDVGTAMSDVWQLISDIFGSLIPYVGEDGFVMFLYWLATFTISFNVGNLAFKRFSGSGHENNGKKMAVTLSIVMSIAATAFTPIETIRLVFTLYSGAFAIALLVALFGWAMKRLWNKEFTEKHPRLAHGLRAALMAAYTVMIPQAKGYFFSDLFSISDSAQRFVEPLLSWAQIIFVILLIWELIQFGRTFDISIGGSGSSSSSSGGSPSASSSSSSGGSPKKSWWSRVFGGKPKDEDVAKLTEAVEKFDKVHKEYLDGVKTVVGFAAPSTLGTLPAAGAVPSGIAGNTTKMANVNNFCNRVVFLKKLAYETFQKISTDAKYQDLDKKLKAAFEAKVVEMNNATSEFLAAYKILQSSMYRPVTP